MQFGLKVLHADETTRKLKDAPYSIEYELGKAFDATGKEIVARAKQIVPVRTGKLRDSIYYHVGPGINTSSLVVGATMPYASFVEKRKPFLRVAVSEKQGVLQAKIKEAVRAALENLQ